MATLASLYSAAISSAGTASNIFGTYSALVTPEINIGIEPETNKTDSFLFHYNGEESAVLDSDITDHYVEDNYAIQDHVSIKPVIISLQGYIGELNNVAPEGLALLQTAADKLTTLSAFAPGLTSTAQNAYNTASQLYRTTQTTYNSVVSAFGSLTGQSSQNKQQEAFTKFYGYWFQRSLFTIQTPWQIFYHMIIQSLRATQTEETRMISEFEITFKQMRFASTVTNNALTIKQGRASDMWSSPVQNSSRPSESISALTGVKSFF